MEKGGKPPFFRLRIMTRFNGWKECLENLGKHEWKFAGRNGDFEFVLVSEI